MATRRDGDGVALIVVISVVIVVIVVIVVVLSVDFPLQNIFDPLLQLRHVREVVLIRHPQPHTVSLGRGGGGAAGGGDGTGGECGDGSTRGQRGVGTQ